MPDSEDETFAETSDAFVFKPSYVLLGIDSHPSMFVKNEEGVSPFEACLSACYQLADSLMFSVNERSWSPFSIVLAHENPTTFVEFKQNILETIKFLKKKSKENNDKLIDKYQRKGDLDIGNFFLYCKKKFKEIKSLFYKRIIIFLTNDDDPARNDANRRFTALNEVKNFDANEMTFQMITMNSSFDYSKFYSELYSLLKNPPIEELVEDTDGLVDKLSSIVVKRYASRKTVLFPFQQDYTRFVKVVQKKFISKPKLYNNQFVTKDGRVVIKTKVNKNPVKKYKLKSNWKEDMSFEKSEFLDTKDSDLAVGFTLIHVSDRQTEVGFVLSAPTLLELQYEEDPKYFNTFWQYCVDKRKVLVCARKMRLIDDVRFVELIPKHINNVRVFLVKNIPFIEDISYPPSATQKTVSEYSSAQFKITSKLVERLTCDYYAKMFSDPQLAKKKAFLKAKLLDEEEEEVEDVTSDQKGIDEQIKDVREAFKEVFCLDGQGTKRKATDTKQKRKYKKYE